MAVVERRRKVLFLPVIRGNYPASLTTAVKRAVREAAGVLGIDGIFPDDGAYTEGLLRTDADLRAYWQTWRGELADIAGLVAFSADFMQERVIQDTVRLLPEDVPVFLMVNNDDPSKMVEGEFGDALCGSLSVHHDVRMLGRRIVRGCRIDMHDAGCLQRFLGEYARLIRGIECLRNMRIAMLGVNPTSFATTFTNQVLLFRLGFSLHTYELLDMWGDVVLGGQLGPESLVYEAPFGPIRLEHPIRAEDPRIAETVAGIRAQLSCLPDDPAKLDVLVRCFLWIKDLFERDGIDTGAIHCWPQFARFFGATPCAFAMLANLLLRTPVVCEVDVCHAIMARLAWELTGEAGVILDANNTGWDPRVFNVFHCSQTPPNWLRDGAELLPNGNVQGIMASGPFTAVSAATSADAFHATVFTGRFLDENPGLRGSSGWAFVPNLPEVLKSIEATGIHHFVALKGHLGRDAADVLRFKELQVNDLSCEVPEADATALGAPPPSQEPRRRCPVYSE